MRYISKCGEDRKSTSEQEHFLYSGQEPGTFYCRAGTGKEFCIQRGILSDSRTHATKSEKQEFIICTENGVRYKLEKDNPDKKFYFTETEPVCMDMKLITLEKVLHVLKTGENEVHLSEELRTDSRKPLEKMLELAK